MDAVSLRKLWARFMMREQVMPSEAFNRIYRGLMKPGMETAGRLIAIILDEPPACPAMLASEAGSGRSIDIRRDPQSHDGPRGRSLGLNDICLLPFKSSPEILRKACL
jgi:hypothetical protein